MKRRTFMLSFWILLTGAAISNIGIIVSLAGSYRIAAGFFAGAAVFMIMGLAFSFAANGGGTERKLATSLAAVENSLFDLSAGIFKLSIGDLQADIKTGQKTASSRTAESGKPIETIMNDINASLTDSADFFNAITFEPCRRLFYVGSDSYVEGRVCGEAAGKILQGKGSVAIILSDTSNVSQILRRKGFIDTLKEKYPNVVVLETLEVIESKELSYSMSRDAMKRIPTLNAFYVAQGATPSEVAKAVEESGHKGNIFIVCHDLTAPTMEAMAKGIVRATVSQDPYAQGYDPVIRLFNAKVDDWRPDAPRILTKLELVTRDNMNQFWDHARGDYSANTAKDHLALPTSRKPSRSVKIAFLCISTDGFWKPLRQGFQDAAAVIAARGGQAEWITTPVGADGKRSASVFAPAIRDLMARRFDAIAVPLFNRDLIPYINEAIESGIIVATYNSDPVSLREMIYSASVHSARLMDMSQEFAAEAEESGRSAKQIDDTMDKMVSSFGDQKLEVTRTKDELDTLVKNIAKVETSAETSAETARKMAAESKNAFEAIVQTRSSVGALESSVSDTARSIEKLKGDTNRIKAIVAAIGDIANQTNILAINASIQAARTGEKGKGFAVIAAEIRKLAEQSNQSAESINQLIADVGSSADNAEKAIVRGLADAKRNVESAARSEQGLSEITSAASENEHRMTDILGVMAEMAAFANGVEKAFTSLLAANRNSEQAATEVDASTAEMASTAAVVAASAYRLADMAKAQQALLSQFAVGKSS